MSTLIKSRRIATAFPTDLSYRFPLMDEPAVAIVDESDRENALICFSCGTNISDFQEPGETPDLEAICDDFAVEESTFDALGAGVCPVCYTPIGDESTLAEFIAR